MKELSAPYRFSRLWLLGLPYLLCFFSCASSHVRQQNTLLRLDGTAVDTSRLRRAVNRLERNYVIQPNDYLSVRVYTNDGEKILDPNGELNFRHAGGRGQPDAGRHAAGRRAGPGDGRGLISGAEQRRRAPAYDQRHQAQRLLAAAG